MAGRPIEFSPDGLGSPDQGPRKAFKQGVWPTENVPSFCYVHVCGERSTEPKSPDFTHEEIKGWRKEVGSLQTNLKVVSSKLQEASCYEELGGNHLIISISFFHLSGRFSQNLASLPRISKASLPLIHYSLPWRIQSPDLANNNNKNTSN